MASWLVVLVFVSLFLALVFFIFRRVSRFLLWFAGFAVILLLLVGIGWMAERRDDFPFELPVALRSFLSVADAPVAVVLDWADGVLQIFLVVAFRIS